MDEIRKAVVFASGTKTGGGSGFEKLVNYASHENTGACYKVCKVVSNHAQGGVYEKAAKLGVPFEYFPPPWSAQGYRDIVERSGASLVVLSGWLKFVQGLDLARTINIHPALLSLQNGRFGGHGLYGHKVHETVAAALERGELEDVSVENNGEPHALIYSGFTMHFVTDGGGDPKEGYDKGPIFAEVRVRIKHGMTADEIGTIVNQAEHRWQPLLTDMVARGGIRLEDGKVIVPFGYGLLPRK